MSVLDFPYFAKISCFLSACKYSAISQKIFIYKTITGIRHGFPRPLHLPEQISETAAKLRIISYIANAFLCILSEKVLQSYDLLESAGILVSFQSIGRYQYRGNASPVLEEG